MKIEVFRGTPDDPENRDKHHFVHHPDGSGEDRIRTDSNNLLRRYRGLFYMGRASSLDEAKRAVAPGSVNTLRQYKVIRYDTADDLKSV